MKEESYENGIWRMAKSWRRGAMANVANQANVNIW